VVGHRELAEAVVVEMPVELQFRGGQRRTLHDHHRGCRRLVVAGSGGDVQVQEGAIEARSVEGVWKVIVSEKVI
jgi:hypothetical protein